MPDFNNWSEDWPQEVGTYWAYRIDHDKPDFIFVKVKKTSNSFVYIGDGRFLYPSEENLIWMKATLPLPPERYK